MFSVNVSTYGNEKSKFSTTTRYNQGPSKRIHVYTAVTYYNDIINVNLIAISKDKGYESVNKILEWGQKKKKKMFQIK